MKLNKKLKKKQEVGESSRRTREKKGITCYKCHKPGHVQQFCPMLKKTFKGSKNEALMATWSDDDSSDSDEDLCFMAFDDEVQSTSSMIDYDELSDMYDNLCKELIKLEKKNKSMKDLMLCMSNELVDFKKEYEKLKDSHNKLNEDNELLRCENGKLKEENGKLSKEHEELSVEFSKARKELNSTLNSSCSLDNFSFSSFSFPFSYLRSSLSSLSLSWESLSL